MDAVHTLGSLRRTLLLRLLAVWLLVTPLAAGIGYWVEVGKFEEGLVALTMQQLHSLSPEIHGGATAESSPLAERTREFVGRNYVWIRVFDARGVLLRQIDNPARHALSQSLLARASPLEADGRRHFDKLVVDGATIIRIMIRLPDENGSQGRMLEGAFELDHLQLVQQRDKLLRFLGGIVLVSLATALALYPVILALNRGVVRASRDILRGNVETAAVLGAAIAKRDSDTGEHNYRVTLYAVALAERLGLERGQIRNLILGAFLHDVGKIGISDAILLKPGRLDDAEFSAMKQHVGLGLDIIANSHWLAAAGEVIGNHHEKFDGSGYPRGLRGEEIPLNARIFAIVDVFDALMSERPYKAPMSLEDALDILREGCGSHFDATFVDVFADMAEGIHRDVRGLSEAALSQMLADQIPRYFFLTEPPR
ncbi:HD-GYP domain-containing protein [Dechloromonas sp. ARDL1]|uniref:HD-GYP domain-containing protein n=1 Tax=Dechloromonas sp. ARDL1 TaxID=3322121 RepID=UPI003DA744D8